MRLWCVSRYQSGAGKFRVGQEVIVDDEEGEFLLRDSPGSFTTEEPKPAATKEPKPEKGKEPAKPEEPEFDVEGATLEELTAFAEANGIELEADASDDDKRAAIALTLEERAKAKLATANGPAGGNTRPARRNAPRR